MTASKEKAKAPESHYVCADSSAAIPNPLPPQVAIMDNPFDRVISELFVPERQEEYRRFAREKYGGMDYYAEYHELVLGTGKPRTTGRKGPLTLALLAAAFGPKSAVVIQGPSYYTHQLAQEHRREGLKDISLPGRIDYITAQTPLDGIRSDSVAGRLFDSITIRDPDPSIHMSKWYHNWSVKDMEEFAEAMIGRLNLDTEHPVGASVFIGTKATTLHQVREGADAADAALKPERVRFFDVFMKVLGGHGELEAVSGRGGPFRTAGEGEEGMLVFIRRKGHKT